MENVSLLPDILYWVLIPAGCVFCALMVFFIPNASVEEYNKKVKEEKEKWKHIESLLSQYSSLEDALKSIRSIIDKLEHAPEKKIWFPWLYKKLKLGKS